MNSDKIRSVEKMINVSIILRLLITAVSALLMAYSASRDIRPQLANDGIILFLPVLIVFFIDTIFTLLWKASAPLYIFHAICYIVFGLIFYMFYFDFVFVYPSTAEYLGMTGALTMDWTFDHHVVLSWAIGLIPFVIYAIGNDKLRQCRYQNCP